MSNIFKLRDDPHAQTQMLLPWYVNGTLDAAESAMVAAHLIDCRECSTALKIEGAMGREIGGLAMDVEQSWAAMRKRLETPAKDTPVAGSEKANVLPFFSRRTTFGWALAGQAAAAALAMVAVVTLNPEAPTASYRALGVGGTIPTGNLIVLFRPDTDVGDVRALLDGSDARVVEGPLSTGAWILKVENARLGAAVARLRASPQIVLVEPLEGDGRR